MPYNFTAIEKKWQQYWLQNKTFRALEPAEAGDKPKAYVLDMFPYPSGAGLHVGHPEGYTATDIVCRHLRMRGHNVLHPMGWDAFGLPAEQYAIQHNTHPRQTTEKNVANFRRQIQMLGLSYDWDREVDTTDPGYYRWTQWIFLQLFNSYFDAVDRKARPIAHLLNELFNDNAVVAPDGSVVVNPTLEGMAEITGDIRVERRWRELSPEEQRAVIDGQRLAYVAEVPVNWCPALGTVLANEEVIDGRSERGDGYPIERRPMRQWMLRITAYADRLLEDLDALDWPESLKEMQRNWIGRSEGAEVQFDVAAPDEHVAATNLARGEPPPNPDYDVSLSVFTTRPDTLYGATYMVLAPEHPLVDQITPDAHRETVEAYREMAAARSERDRMTDSKEKTGIFTGAYAINPANDERLPIYVADYVLMGYGTGAIMAVPAHDERDFEFARKFGLPIRTVVAPPDDPTFEVKDAPYVKEGVAVNSEPINGMATERAKERMIEFLENLDDGRREVQYKLRDWLFSRQRYWGEPFPILLDADGNPTALPEEALPVLLPELTDFKPSEAPEPPLSKATEWLAVQRDGVAYTRETNTMPQWAGSCWYYLRYIDPHNAERLVDPEKERYWMPVDLYVGGVEHAVLHLLYSRFTHKALYDLGHVSSPEPFQRLVNQGLILGELECYAFRDASGAYVSASELTDIKEDATAQGAQIMGTHRDTQSRLVGVRVSETEVEKVPEGFRLKANPAIRVDARSYKMSKARGNVVNPDEVVRDYGADAFRLYEMYMGPLETQKPWNTRDIVGMARFLNSAWRNLIGEREEDGGTRTQGRVADVAIADALERQMHRTIKKVGEDISALRFNTAIAELIKLNNAMTTLEAIPRELAINFTLMLAPFAPHVAEELWERLGNRGSLAYHAWPAFDEAKLAESSMELPVQVNGKVRDKITVPAEAGEAEILRAAEGAEKVRPWLAGKEIRKRMYVPKRLVNFVVG